MVRRSEPWSILRRSCLSADVLGPLLLVGFLFGLGSGRKLQDCCILTFLEMSQKHLLAVWHFKHIVMDVRAVSTSNSDRYALRRSHKRALSAAVWR